jgi:hypothetical protein
MTRLVCSPQAIMLNPRAPDSPALVLSRRPPVFISTGAVVGQVRSALLFSQFSLWPCDVSRCEGVQSGRQQGEGRVGGDEMRLMAISQGISNGMQPSPKQSRRERDVSGSADEGVSGKTASSNPQPSTLNPKSRHVSRRRRPPRSCTLLMYRTGTLVLI